MGVRFFHIPLTRTKFIDVWEVRKDSPNRDKPPRSGKENISPW